jgi:hypothetical protein
MTALPVGIGFYPPSRPVKTSPTRLQLVVCGGDNERVSLLNRPWTLRDVEALMPSPEASSTRTSSEAERNLRPDVHYDATAFLLEVAVKADRSFDPAGCGSFERYLRWKLKPRGG